MSYSLVGNSSFLILFLLLFFRCSIDPDTNNEITDHFVPSAIEIYPSDSIVLKTDSIPLFRPERYSYVEDDSLGGFLCLYNIDVYDRVNQLLFFETTGGELTFKIDLSNYTSAIIEDFFVQSLDTVIIYADDRKQFLRLSVFSESEEILWSKKNAGVGVEGFPNMRIDFKDDQFFVRMPITEPMFQGLSVEQVFEQFFNQKSVFGILSSPDGIKSIGEYPSHYKDIKNKVFLAHINFPQMVKFNEALVANFMLDKYLYLYSPETLQKYDSIFCGIKAVDIDSTIAYINSKQAKKDSVIWKSYQRGNFFDIKVSPNREVLYRSAFANQYNRYVLKINKDFEIENSYYIPASSKMTLAPLIPTNNGFYLIRVKNYRSKPTLLFYATPSNGKDS